MLIVCPNCAASYNVAGAKLGPNGRSVRCVRCQTVWFASAAAEAPAVAAAPAKALAVAGPPAGSPGRPAAEQPPAGVPESALVASEGAHPSADKEAPPAGPAPAAEKPAAPAAGESAADASSGPPALPANTEGPPPVDQAPRPDAPDGEAPGLPALAEGAAPPLVPGLAENISIAVAPAGAPAVEAAANEDVESLAALRARRSAGARRKRQTWRPSLPAVIIVLIAVIAGLVAGRNQVVRYAPQTASLFKAIGLPVNVRGIRFENVKTMREMQDGVMVLIVEGTVANVTPSIVDVPRLRFALRNPAGLEIYAWTAVAGRPVIGPGESTGFSSRLASPPADGREVVVRFLTRRDLVAGGR